MSGSGCRDSRIIICTTSAGRRLNSLPVKAWAAGVSKEGRSLCNIWTISSSLHSEVGTFLRRRNYSGSSMQSGMVSPQIPSSVIRKDIDFKSRLKYTQLLISTPPRNTQPASHSPGGGFVTSLSYVYWDTGPELWRRSIKICWPNKSPSFGYIYILLEVRGGGRGGRGGRGGAGGRGGRGGTAASAR